MAAFMRHVRGYGKVIVGFREVQVPVLSCRHGGQFSVEKPLVYLSQHRKLHVASRHHLRNLPRLGQRSQRTHALGAVLAARYNSTEAMGAADQTLQVPDSTIPPVEFIPEPPPVPVPETETFVESLTSLGEPTLQSLGLAGWTPSGFVQWAIEGIHCGLDLPWWSAIVIGTVCVRICLFPLVIKSQKNAAKMHNHMPTIQRLQNRFTESRQSGNAMEAARAGSELQAYMKRHNVTPFKSFLVPLAQVPIFLSVFVGIRQMASLPVESMSTGGLLWFKDLTLADPYMALPLMTMATFLATVEMGVDGMKAGSMTHNMKWIMRGMPIIIFPLIMNFPTAMLCYWFTSNAFSLVQVLFLKIPGMKPYFGIEEAINHPEHLKPKSKPFIKGFKESWKNAKLTQQMEERSRLDAIKFKEAGIGPIQKTYSFDPTKSRQQQKAISAKSKSS